MLCIVKSRNCCRKNLCPKMLLEMLYTEIKITKLWLMMGCYNPQKDRDIMLKNNHGFEVLSFDNIRYVSKVYQKFKNYCFKYSSNPTFYGLRLLYYPLYANKLLDSVLMLVSKASKTSKGCFVTLIKVLIPNFKSFKMLYDLK